MKLEQQQELMARLSIMQKLSLAEAMEILNVSESTIRRIFAKMEKEGVAIRTHGGIQSASGAMTRYSFEYGTKTNIEKKTAIAREACKLLKNGDVIFCDTGTTTQCFCAELVCRIKREGLNVKLYTNSLAAHRRRIPTEPQGFLRLSDRSGADGAVFQQELCRRGRLRPRPAVHHDGL